MVDGTINERPAFKDPRPSVERISQLAQRVLSGDILLPKFQRDFVWPRNKVLGLLDSIAHNYPIGSILLWQSKQPLASERTIARLQIAATKPDYPVNYLLDGQQRLSTICGALYWRPTADPDSIWNIAYDLRAREFLHLDTLDDPPLSHVPLRYLSEPAAFFRRLSALDDSEQKNAADSLFNRIQDYMIAAVTLGDMTIEDIAPIFERINSTATPLTIVDLMRAATWDPDFDLRDAIDNLLVGLETRDFHRINRKTILRAVAAGAGFGFAVDDIDRLRSKNVDELKKVMIQVADACKRTVDFLTSHISVPYPEALPYANQFAVLTELFRRVPVPTGPQFTSIERWFWRTTLSGYFGGWNTGQMARDWDEVIKFSEASSNVNLDVPASLPRSDVWKVSQFRSNSAVSKMLALILSFKDPRDILTGQRIDARRSLAWNNDKEFHHFFPRNFLKSQNIGPRGRENAAANIVLLSSSSNVRISNKAPSEYLGQVIQDVGREELLRRLQTLLVSEDAMEAALRDDYFTFLDARAETLHSMALGLVGESGNADVGSPIIRGETLVNDEIDINDVSVSNVQNE